MKTKRRVGIVLILFGVAAVLCAGVLILSSLKEEDRAARENASVLNSLKNLIQADPDQAVDSDLPVLPAGGYDCVGFLEVEGTDLAWPVESSSGTGKWLPCVDRGNPSDGDFVIRGAYKKNVFASLSEIQPGDIIRFVQVNGAEKEYIVDSSGLVQGKENITADALLLECRHQFGARYIVSARARS
jgi:hypothetical protein